MSKLSLEKEADFECLKDIAVFVDQALEKWDMTDEARGEFCMAIDEIITNIILYGYPDRKGKISITLTKSEDFITAEISDQGIPFDPTRQPAPDITAPLDERPVGGLGIHLVRNMVDDFRYNRSDNSNYMVLTKKSGRKK